MTLKIPSTLQPLIDATRRDAPSLLKQLQVGQLLQARVLDQIQPGLLRLQIASAEVLARSQVAIAPGTRLKLEVVKGQPLPELRVLREPDAQQRQQQVVRSAMARQLSPQELRQAVSELRAQASTPRQAEALRQLTTIVQESGVRPAQPAATQLQRAIAQSGVFHEARLAAGLPANPADTKVQLLRLLVVLREDLKLPPKAERQAGAAIEQQAPARDMGVDSLLNRLIRLVEESIARIQLQQAVALPAEEGQRQAWQLDLPIRLPGETHEAMLRIERDDAGKAGGTPSTWAVNLAFQFDTIGTLQCRIALAGDHVSATFWCERTTTLAHVEQRLPVLRQAFEAQGLDVIRLAGVLGAPPEPLIKVPIPDSLLDERA